MRANRRRDTGPELAVRAELHRRGLRYRVDFPVPVAGRSPRPDVVFTKQRVAVFIDGCFWHGCPQHAQRPKQNSVYWEPKISRNIERDLEQAARLEAAGWTVIRVWEHEDPSMAAERISATVRTQ
jgi:DNA mismatch endonuclease, patch repair protein